MVEQLLRTLVGQRVLHVVPYTLGESRYEITHDVLGQAILQWQERYQLKAAQHAEQQRLREEAETALAERQAAEKLAEEQRQAAKRLRRLSLGLAITLVAALIAVAVAVVFFFNAQNAAQNAHNAEAVAQANAVEAVNARVTAQASATNADNAKATAQANLSLAQQKLDELKVEELLTSAHDKSAQLNVNGAVADFNAAVAAASARGRVLDVSSEISDTLRYVATAYVREGEKTLCNAFYDQPQKCEVPLTGQAAEPMTASVAIEQKYLAWAQDVAPQIVGWSSYTSTVQQDAVISATALYSQALALNPPPDTPVYVWIAPGAFDMGSTDEQSATAGIGECPSDEQPHRVELDSYWMQRTEVTNEQYKRCVDAGGCPDEPSNPLWKVPRSARLPVTAVDWGQASAYAAWVGGRLPTEAEWEKGCRSADGRIYPWGDEQPAMELLNYNSKVGGTTEIVTYPPGANGLYDMAGNVWEWIADWYGEDYYKSSPKRNPAGPEEGEIQHVAAAALGSMMSAACAALTGAAAMPTTRASMSDSVL